MGGAQDGREDWLGLCPARVAGAAADLAHHDGGSNRVLGAPVGRVDRGIAEEREEGRRFARQMRDEALDGGNGGSHTGEQVPRLGAPSAARAGRRARRNSCARHV